MTRGVRPFLLPRSLLLFGALAAPAGLAVLAACGDATGPDRTLAGPAGVEARLQPDHAAASPRYAAHLTGGQEVPAVATAARGQALFSLSADGSELSYRLIVANLEDVLMSHIHLAPAGSNGGVVAWLYPSAPPPQLIEGRTSGVLAEGVITAADLVGALAGQPLAALLAEMDAGGAYVNVHTEANPGGEIRGQIR